MKLVYCLGISLQDIGLATIVYMDALYKVHSQFAVGLASIRMFKAVGL
jgi:hypothetical protein